MTPLIMKTYMYPRSWHYGQGYRDLESSKGFKLQALLSPTFVADVMLDPTAVGGWINSRARKNHHILGDSTSSLYPTSDRI